MAVNKPTRCRSRTLEGRREAWWMDGIFASKLLLERDVRQVDVHDRFSRSNDLGILYTCVRKKTARRYIRCVNR